MIAIIDCGSTKVPLIAEMAGNYGKPQTIVQLDEVVSTDFSICEAVILSGGPVMISQADQQPFIIAGRHLVASGKPLLGICLGHQILSLTFNGHVSMGTEDRDLRQIGVLKSHALFDELGQSFTMMQDHCEEATVPELFDLLASSSTCPVEAMVHQSLPIVGVQFHPETSGSNGQRFINNFFRFVAGI